jgi:hypothetical protein
MFYATQDADGGWIEEEALIEAFETEAEAREYLLAPYRNGDWDLSTAEIGIGSFSDCWIKSRNDPLDYEDDFGNYTPFSMSELSVRGPGEHPGGWRWWITPVLDVLVVTSIRAAIMGGSDDEL